MNINLHSEKFNINFASRNPRLQSLKMDALSNLLERNEWDICFFHKYPFNVICNFYPANFDLDGVKISSMEGFLQALKISNERIQKDICKLIGPFAKKLGYYLKNVGSFDGKNLFWKGKRINRFGDDYIALLQRAYTEKFSNNSEFRQVLGATKGYTLTHKIGLKNPQETILTDAEFLAQLNRLREKISSSDCTISQLITRIIEESRSSDTVKDLVKLGTKKIYLLNDRIMLGPSIKNTAIDNILRELKNSHIDTIISTSNKDVIEKSKLCNKYGIKYINISLNSVNNIEHKVNKLIKLLNGKKIYMEYQNNPNDCNLPLALNYLFNPTSNISNAVLPGTIKNDLGFIHKLLEIKSNIQDIDSEKFSKKLKTLLQIN